MTEPTDPEVIKLLREIRTALEGHDHRSGESRDVQVCALAERVPQDPDPNHRGAAQRHRSKNAAGIFCFQESGEGQKRRVAGWFGFVTQVPGRGGRPGT